MNEYIAIIKRLEKGLLDPDATQEDLIKTCELIIRDVKTGRKYQKEVAEIQSSIRAAMLHKNTMKTSASAGPAAAAAVVDEDDDDDEDEDDEQIEQDWFYHLDKGLTVHYIPDNSDIFNKVYTRTDLDKTISDWKINIVNMADRKIDIMDEVFQKYHRYNKMTRGHTDSTITLQELLEFLQGNGVKRIILFDLSCANIADKDYEKVITSKRSLNAIRRAILRGKVFYGTSTNKKRNSTTSGRLRRKSKTKKNTKHKRNVKNTRKLKQ